MKLKLPYQMQSKVIKPVIFTISNRSILILSFLLILGAESSLLNCNAQLQDSIINLINRFEYNQAIDLINETDTSHSDLKLLEQKVIALKGLKKYKEAILVYNEMRQIGLNNTTVITGMANCYQSIGDFRSAQEL